MERKTAGLLGALAGLATLGGTGAQAATDATLKPEPLAVTSYADLLRPIPDAAAALQIHNAELMARAANAPVAEQVDWNGNDHHHHHHHHHNSYYAPPPPVYYYPPPPPPPYYHHHHHHHSGAVIVVPGIGIQIN
ncbi:MAG: hypothetical protein KGK02_00275 [Rhodospirillales bacterium]|nr:hypothetical protein [Rhodospirillales bacterium]